MNGEYKGTIEEWKRLSDMDLTTAHRICELFHPMPIEIVCFHAQQAAEKMLKCFLVLNEVEPPYTHNLKLLIDMCAEIESGFSDLEREAITLSQYGVLPRYPAEYDLDEPDAELALKYADKITEYANGLVFPLTEVKSETEKKNPADEINGIGDE
jgi:HEPN domain-containing protein